MIRSRVRHWASLRPRLWGDSVTNQACWCPWTAKQTARSFAATAYSSILTELKGDHGNVGLITLNRPKQLNALNKEVCDEVISALQHFDRSSGVKAMIITGQGKAFAAGADIKEMAPVTFKDAVTTQMLAGWEVGIKAIQKPIVAAVNGYALGGGCELAMMCDIAIASPRALFGQPELTLGVIPGMGGTQRMLRAVGKSLAMEVILTDRRLDAYEALQAGLVSKVVEGNGEEPEDALLQEAIRICSKIGTFSAPAVALAKRALRKAEEVGLSEGLDIERQLFHAGFSLNDQKEGMAAFLEKRPAQFTDS